MKTKRLKLSEIVPVSLLALSCATSSAWAASKSIANLPLGSVIKHLEALQQIAGKNGGNREAGTSGDLASRDYAISQLTKAGFKVTTQNFAFDYFQAVGPSTLEVVSPSPKTYHEWTEENPAQSTDDFRYVQYSGVTQNLPGGVVEAPVQAVDVVIPPGATPNSSNSGCESADFTGFTAGNIALIQRGTCPFAVKVANAITAGAKGVILFNEGQPENPGIWPDRIDVFGASVNVPVSIPVVFARFGVGQELYTLSQAGSVTVRLGVNAINEARNTANIIAERQGQTNRVFMAGANLDSDFATPGINNNGSGAATLLAIATSLGTHKVDTYNTLRFVLWGASYSGNAGAYYYLDPANITKAERAKITGFLSVDTIGSKNGVPFVYDSDGSSIDPIFGAPGAPGSAKIEAVLYQALAQQGVTAAPRPIEQLSDYKVFIPGVVSDDMDIPFGAITAGFGKTGRSLADKTELEAATYGGTAGQPYDPCSLQACDTVKNISKDILTVMATTAGNAILTLANDKDLPTR